MSASLVGSEMCIRDRGMAGLQLQRNLRAQVPQQGTLLLAPRPHPTHTDTVSYTHLTLPTICSV
eukprot:4071400-Alexandrium_andersonii.AAC.1